MFYVSYLLQKFDSGTGANRNVELSLNAGSGTQVVRLGSSSSNQGANLDESRFFFGGVSPTQFSEIPVSYDQNYFIVLKGVTSAAGNDEFFAAIYDPTDTVPNTEPATWDMTYSITSIVTIDQLRPTLGTQPAWRIR